jgi:hypothetical protein
VRSPSATSLQGRSSFSLHSRGRRRRTVRRHDGCRPAGRRGADHHDREAPGTRLSSPPSNRDRRRTHRILHQGKRPQQAPMFLPESCLTFSVQFVSQNTFGGGCNFQATDCTEFNIITSQPHISATNIICKPFDSSSSSRSTRGRCSAETQGQIRKQCSVDVLKHWTYSHEVCDQIG